MTAPLHSICALFARRVIIRSTAFLSLVPFSSQAYFRCTVPHHGADAETPYTCIVAQRGVQCHLTVSKVLLILETLVYNAFCLPFNLACLEMCLYILCLCCGNYNKRWRPRPLPRKPLKPDVPQRPPISLEPRSLQEQCPLFGPRFPAELRVKIYEAALGVLDRLLHIIPFDDQSNRVGRRRCEDTAYGGPTSQHRCLGTWLSPKRTSRTRVFEFWPEDRLLACLLTCHRMCVYISFQSSSRFLT